MIGFSIILRATTAQNSSVMIPNCHLNSFLLLSVAAGAKFCESHREEENNPRSRDLDSAISSFSTTCVWWARKRWIPEGHDQRKQKGRSPDTQTVDGIRRRDDFTSNLTYIPCIHTAGAMASGEHLFEYIRLPLRAAIDLISISSSLFFFFLSSLISICLLCTIQPAL